MAPDSRAYQSASARMSRPSASVLEISIVFPAERRDDVARAERVAARQVLAGGNHGEDPNRQAQLCDRSSRREDGAAAAHVRLHLVHAIGGLQREAARVEGDRLADEPEAQVGLRRFGGLVGQRDQPGGLWLPWLTAAKAPMPAARISSGPSAS